MVVDSSVILAIFFGEPHGRWAVEQLDKNAAQLVMSTVNLSECLIRLKDRQPTLHEKLEAKLLGSAISFIAPDVQQACLAAEARIRFPINLGDCFAYALACSKSFPILSIDRDFQSVDCDVVLPFS